MHRSYDAIISLGGNCGAASQLRMRGLRPFSLPFDWTYMTGPESIEWLCRGFESGFADFCLRENLEPIAHEASGLAPFKYRDRASGYSFIHHFWTSIDTEKGYHVTYDILRRRVDRLQKTLERGSSFLFILATNFEYDPSLAVRLLGAIRRCHPGKTVDMRVMQHCAKFDNPLTLAERWPDDLPFEGGRYARRIFTYDFSRTDTEWEFLDSLSLSSVCAKKPFRGIDRIRYKLWKSFSKYFRDNGFACAALRFR